MYKLFKGRYYQCLKSLFIYRNITLNNKLANTHLFKGVKHMKLTNQ